MIEQYASTILAVSIALNALWLLGAWLVLRSSQRKWLWRPLSLIGAALAIAWTASITGTTPSPTHILRMPLLTINLDLAAIAWHAIVLPLGLLAMVVRGVVVVARSRTSATKSRRKRHMQSEASIG